MKYTLSLKIGNFHTIISNMLCYTNINWSLILLCVCNYKKFNCIITISDQYTFDWFRLTPVHIWCVIIIHHSLNSCVDQVKAKPHYSFMLLKQPWNRPTKKKFTLAAKIKVTSRWWWLMPNGMATLCVYAVVVAVIHIECGANTIGRHSTKRHQPQPPDDFFTYL